MVFEDGTIAVDALITVYNENEEKLLAADVDQNGQFNYSDLEEASFLVASDPMGHRAEWEIGEELSARRIDPGQVILVVIFFLAAALFFYYKNRGEKDNEKS